MIKKGDLKILVCPLCKKKCLVYKQEYAVDEVIERGELYCAECEISFPLVDGIVNFMPSWRLSRKEMGFWQSRRWENKLKRFMGWREKHYKKLEEKHGETRCEQQRSEEKGRLFFEFCGEIKGYILEVGCGGGWNKEFYKGRLFGIDPIVLKSGKDYDFFFCQGIGEFLPFKDQFFDSVTMIAMLDHVLDLDKSFEEVFRVLKSKGKLYIMTTVEEKQNHSRTNSAKLVNKFNTFMTKIANRKISDLFYSFYYRIIYSRKISEFLRSYTHTYKIKKERLLQCVEEYVPRSNIVLKELPHERLLFLKLTYEDACD